MVISHEATPLQVWWRLTRRAGHQFTDAHATPRKGAALADCSERMSGARLSGQ